LLQAVIKESKTATWNTELHSLIDLHAILIDVFSNTIKTAYPTLENISKPSITTGNKFSDYQCNASMQICKLLNAKGNV